MMPTDLSPHHGVRVKLELAEAGEHGVAYDVELHAPSSAFASRVTIAIGGALAFGPWRALEGAGEPEPWMIESARGFLRTLHKNHVADRDWPRRWLRWRDRR